MTNMESIAYSWLLLLSLIWSILGFITSVALKFYLYFNDSSIYQNINNIIIKNIFLYSFSLLGVFMFLTIFEDYIYRHLKRTLILVRPLFMFIGLIACVSILGFLNLLNIFLFHW